MPQLIFVNLPVKDLEVSKAFFTKLGYTINPQFTDENAACVVISDTIYAMLITEPFFKQFTKKDIADATATTEVLVCLTADSREAVDQLVDTALASGGSPANDTQEQGPMYGRSFQDPDGHIWEVMWMDPAAVQG
ncbi:VOC family protein [Streptomyces sp. NPDC051322]|uniref:VOC family protein n=1 Tax=Streptomyces sp. NPDC051322 TaxID=3154645 RepID=UPI0034503475